MTQDQDFIRFEQEWAKLGNTICQSIYKDSRIQQLKSALQKKGFLNLEEKSEFLDICDSTKYKIIYATYGPEGSEGYNKFLETWSSWFQKKGVSSTACRSQRNSVDHIMFGSTPDPQEFLLNFEHEIPTICEK